MGGCASKPKESDDGLARGSPLSSDNPQITTNGDESPIEKHEHVAEKEVQTSSCETVSAVTEVPKTEDEVESTNEDKVEAAIEQPVKEAEAAEKKPDNVPQNNEEVKSNAPVASL